MTNTISKLESDNKRKEQERRTDLASEIFDVVNGMYMLYSLTTDDADDDRLIVTKIEDMSDLLDLPLHIWMDTVDDASRIEANTNAAGRFSGSISEDRNGYTVDSDTVVFMDFESLSKAFETMVLSQDSVKYASYHVSHLTGSEISRLDSVLSSYAGSDPALTCITDKPPIPRFAVGCYKARPDIICIIDTAGDNNFKITVCPPVSYDGNVPEYCGFLKQEYTDLVLQNKLGKPYLINDTSCVLQANNEKYVLYKFAANTLDFYDTRGCAYYERKRDAFLAQNRKQFKAVDIQTESPVYQGFRF